MSLTLSNLVAHARNTGGITVRRLTTGNWIEADHTDGFYVSLSGGLERVEDDMLVFELINFITQNLKFLNTADYLLGLWRDEDGKWSIDITTHYNTRDIAELAGAIFDQRAIFDIKNESVITL